MLQINNTISTKKSKTKKTKSLNLKDISFNSILLSVSIFVVIMLILFNPTRYAQSVVNGLKLFTFSVLPGLLPCMFLCKLLVGLGVIEKIAKPFNKLSQKLFGIKANGLYCFILSALSGYPVGAKLTTDLYKKGLLADQDITKTAIFSSVSGLEFVVGVVGGALLNSPLLGLIIYISNVVAVIIVSIIINAFSKNKSTLPNIRINNQQETKKENILVSATLDTCSSLLVVGFYIALFSMIIDLLTDLKIFSFLSSLLGFIFSSNTQFIRLSQYTMSGIIEMTNGAKLLSTNITPISVSLISFLTSFSGLSIILQSLAFLSQTPINKSKFVFAKVFQAIISFIICFIILLLFYK